MPRILVTNDDGIHSPGIHALAKALSRVGTVVVVAPDRDQSGFSMASRVSVEERDHKLVVTKPLKFRRVMGSDGKRAE